jgi:hypothetical protein
VSRATDSFISAGQLTISVSVCAACCARFAAGLDVPLFSASRHAPPQFVEEIQQEGDVD